MARKVVVAAITGLLVIVVGPALFERLAPRRWVVAYQRAWLVAGDRSRSQYVKNIEANPTVRVRARGRWHTGTAHVLVHDNPRHRLLTMNPINSAFIWIAGTDPATVRIDFDPGRRRRPTRTPPAS
jgi:hypothetical protein